MVLDKAAGLIGEVTLMKAGSLLRLMQSQSLLCAQVARAFNEPPSDMQVFLTDLGPACIWRSGSWRNGRLPASHLQNIATCSTTAPTHQMFTCEKRISRIRPEKPPNGEGSERAAAASRSTRCSRRGGGTLRGGRTISTFAAPASPRGQNNPKMVGGLSERGCVLFVVLFLQY